MPFFVHVLIIFRLNCVGLSSMISSRIKCRPFDKKLTVLYFVDTRFRATTHLVLAQLSWQLGSFLSSLHWISQILSLSDGDTWLSGIRVMSLTLPQWEGVDCWLEFVSWFNSLTSIVESLLISEKIWLSSPVIKGGTFASCKALKQLSTQIKWDFNGH